MKRHRFFIVRKYLRDTNYPLAYINISFALLPMFISGEWIWLKKYYKLITIESALSFGGITTVRYSCLKRGLSKFEFKTYLKSEGIIKNFVSEKRNFEEKKKTWPKWLVTELEKYDNN